MSFDEIMSKYFVGIDIIVVRILRIGEIIFGLVKDLIIGVKKSVFLFEIELRFSVFGGVYYFFVVSLVVGFVRGIVVVVIFVENENVGVILEGVFEDGNRMLLEEVGFVSMSFDG